MPTFTERLFTRIRQTGSRVCLGIDPRPKAHPLTHPERFKNDPAQVAKSVVHYFRGIIETSEDIVACYKLQSAFFEALGIPGLIALAQLIADIKARGAPVILDAKRGDIGVSAEAYAEAYLAGGVFSSDALTVSPYLGEDGLEPFIHLAEENERGLFVLVKTSNFGSADFQELMTEGGRRLYQRVAEKVRAWGEPLVDVSGYSPLGAVVGATYPDELAELRRMLPHSVLLVSGYGTQGASAEDVAAAFDSDGLGAVVNASYSLTYVTEGDDFPQRARAAALAMSEAINRSLNF
jgi:orotidine-5'-phosphate decarboxylase